MATLWILLTVLVGTTIVLGLLMFLKNQKIPRTIGLREGKLAPLPSSPNAVSSQTDIKASYVDPLEFKEDLSASRSAVLKALQQYDGATIMTEFPDYIHAVCTTRRLRFKDDLEFYFDEQEKKIHFRSASRVGYSDMGVNKKRYLLLAKRYTNC